MAKELTADPLVTFAFEAHCLEHLFFEHLTTLTTMPPHLPAKLGTRSLGLMQVAAHTKDRVTRILASEALLREIEGTEAADDWRAWFRGTVESMECPTLRQALAGMRVNALHLGLDGPLPAELWRIHVQSGLAGSSTVNGNDTRRGKGRRRW